jgi:hypothetical protein
MHYFRDSGRDPGPGCIRWLIWSLFVETALCIAIVLCWNSSISTLLTTELANDTRPCLFQKSVHLHDIGIAFADCSKNPLPVR